MEKHRAAAVAILVVLVLFLFPSLTWGAKVDPDALYQEAKSCAEPYLSKKNAQSRAQWEACLEKFLRIQDRYPRSRVADDALFMAARIYHKLYEEFKDPSGAENALLLYERVATEYPDSPVADDALLALGDLLRSDKGDLKGAMATYQRLVKEFPQGDMAKVAQARLKALSGTTAPKGSSPDPKAMIKASASGETLVRPLPPQFSPSSQLNRVRNIQYWSNANYTRIAIDLDRKVKFEEHRLTDPDRLYFDLFDSKIEKQMIQHALEINDRFLRRVRAGQNQKEVVRIVLDVDQIDHSKAFILDGPEVRLIIDVSGKELPPQKEKTVPLSEGQKKVEMKEKKKPLSLADQLGLGVKRIVIDPGHGGKDTGAIGENGLEEKTVVLDIAKRLRTIIKERTQFDVKLTREDDRFLSLEERTALANTLEADLFISIHANASEKRGSHGIETYFLNLASTPDARATAARENSTSQKKVSDLESILRDLMVTSKIDESSRLAGLVQNTVVKSLKPDFLEVKNLGVKQAPFVVLIGASMPSILVEVGFLTNPIEEKRLGNAKYRLKVSHAIFAGMIEYINRNSGKLAFQPRNGKNIKN